MMNGNEESVISVIGRLALRLILVALAVLVLFVAGTYAYRFGKDIFYQSPMETAPGTDVEIQLPEDVTYEEFARILQMNGLIRNKEALSIQARLYKTALVPGTYVLNTSMTAKELLTAVGEAAQKLTEAEESKESSETVQDDMIVVGGGDEEGAADGNQ